MGTITSDNFILDQFTISESEIGVDSSNSGNAFLDLTG